MPPLAIAIAFCAAGLELLLARHHLTWLRTGGDHGQTARTIRQAAALMLAQCALALAGAGGLTAELARLCGLFSLTAALALTLAVEASVPLGRRQLARTGWRALLALPFAALAGWVMPQLGEAGWLAGWAIWLGLALCRDVFPAGKLHSPAPATLAALAGVKVVMVPGSPQLNARAEGIFGWRRIVLNDSILALPPESVAAITAHEAGHLAGRHREKHLGWRAVQVLMLLAAAQGLGLMAEPLAGSVLLILLARPLALLIRPAETMLLHRWEFQADAHAAKLVGAGTMAAALRGLFAANATALIPEPLYALFHGGHPAPAERLRRLTPAPSRSLQ